jgi:simple sugar transport system ATP-binding protein
VTPAALQLSGICKRFGGVTALDNATFAVRPGSVHALLGENGAGKTTLMRIAFGLLGPDAGTVSIDGRAVRFRSPADAIGAGIGMVQQHFTVVPALTTLENIALGWSSSRKVRSSSLRLAVETGLRVEPDVLISQLTVADQQRVELLKALVRGAKVLILDEPTASLAPADSGELLSWIRGFAARGGSVVLITHKLREALDVADEISVLRRGVVTWSAAREHASIEHLVTAMMGESTASKSVGPAPAPTTRRPMSSSVVRAERLVVQDARGVVRIRDVWVSIRGGEIVGVAGVDGSGKRELLYALAGRLRPTSGELRLPDEIGFIPEDRQREALVLDASVAENVALRGAGRRRGWYRRSNAERAAEQLTLTNGIRVADVRESVSTLSGGNQQRLVLARELHGNPPLVVAVNPTRGLDIAATAQVQRRLRKAADDGAAIVYHSTDLDELLEVADRVLVVFDGRVREVDRDRDVIGRAMLGAESP